MSDIYNDFQLNPVGLGTNAVGNPGYNPISDEESHNMILTALDLGVNFFDTAYYYGMGGSEEVIGDVLKKCNARNKILLATKGAHRMEKGEIVVDNHPDFLVDEVYKSLKRLKTDYIDIYYIHFPDEKTPKYEAVGALQKLREKGIIREIGVSNFSLEQIEEANRDGYIDVVQDEYNLLVRDKEEKFIPYLRKNNIAFIPYFPLAAGLLTGKYTLETEIPERRRKNPNFSTKYEENLRKIDLLRRMAKEKDCEVYQLVLAWYLETDFIDAVIPGAKHADQIRANQKTRKVKISETEFQEISTIFR
ncbi:aldo/keto reductase [Proteiniclasticum sp. C24MP]|uniref:aldo/keto reductase n=1 Tax=Proteiniclasticum sp. C24MP TaxID=3374101 RepID=UPI0037548693